MQRRRLLALGASALGFGGWSANRGGPENGPAEGQSTSVEAANDGLVEADAGHSRATTSRVGASLNGRARRLRGDFELLERSNTTWLHGFLDVRSKYVREVDPRDDPDVKALQRAGREMGVKLIVALKWNFTGNFENVEPTHVPPSGSDRRRALFEYATELLLAIDRPVEIVVLGNEPVWEAPDRDVLGTDSPLVSFTRELKEHLVANYTVGDPQYLVGSFNRLYGAHVRRKYGSFYDQLFEMVRTDTDIDGIDLHVHYDGIQQAREMLAIARKRVPKGTITVTEVSPVWRYKRNMDRSIGSFPSGQQFASQYGIPPGTTVLEYYRAAKENPRSRREMGEFMEAMPWYHVDFVEDLYDLLNSYNIDIGTFGLLQDAGFRHMELTADWIPFQINFLFQQGVIATGDGAHPHYLDDYRKRA